MLTIISSFFSGVFDTSTTTTIGVGTYLMLIGVALASGAAFAFAYRFRNSSATKSFLLTLGILPAVVCVVIMLVNGNVGAGIAVVGVFGLVRFRSAQGTAREIAAVFIQMCVGLALGMGYVGYAVVFAVIMIAVFLVVGLVVKPQQSKILKITVPEDLDYCGVFDSVLGKYTSSHKLVAVKTTNLGSLFKLTYEVTLKSDVSEKQFIDELRVLNGNLEIALHYAQTEQSAL